MARINIINHIIKTAMTKLIRNILLVLLFIAGAGFKVSAVSHPQETKRDSLTLSEVVVVGYGTQQRQQLTKSVSSIDEKDIELLAPVSTTVQDLLGSGLAKGVLSIQNSGEPGAAPTINIRGITSPYPSDAGDTCA